MDGNIEVLPGLDACVCDCNGDGWVTINEVVLAVNVAIGTTAVGICAAADLNKDGKLTINEIVAGVGAVFADCQPPLPPWFRPPG